MKHHLSMRFIAEKYLIRCLEDLNDDRLDEIIEDKLTHYITIKNLGGNYEVIGTGLVNAYWQKIAYFAVKHHTSVAKIATCLFDYSLTAYELKFVFEEHGLSFKEKKVKGTSRQNFNERVSDY